MKVGKWGRVLLIEATKEEWSKLSRRMVVQISKTNYDPVNDTVVRESKDFIIAAGIEHNKVYAVAFPSFYGIVKDYNPELDETIKAELERISKPIKVRDVFPYELRPYQKEAVEAFFAGNEKALIALPTGTGKTIVALYIIWKLRKRTLILVPTETLVNQWLERVRQITDDVCVYKKGKCGVTIATYAAFNKAEMLNDFYLMVADEGHHLPADKWSEFLKTGLWPARLVLSATPRRPDGNHKILHWFVGGNIYHKSYSQLVQEGYVAPLKVYVVWVKPYNVELVEKYYQLYKNERGLSSRTASYKAKLKRYSVEDRAKAEVLESLVERHPSSKFIVFTEFVEHAYKLGRMFEAGVITGREPPDKRTRVIEAFKAGKLRMLVVTSAAEEGVDLPDADVAVMFATPSERQIVQRLGRVLRPKAEAYAYFIFLSKYQDRDYRKLKRALASEGIDVPIKNIVAYKKEEFWS